MSYDLFFETRSGRKIDSKSFARYFDARRHYKVGNGQAVYQNEDTGVYFIFDEPEDGVVQFNLNFYRPHVFGLEAAIELEAFSKAFGMTVTDPQDEGMGDEAVFSRERFLHGWNAGNRFAYRSMLADKSEQPVSWPAKRIREVWVWNHTRPAEDDQSADIFVPAIFPVEVDGKVGTVVVWPPQCSILMPAVDAVLVPLAQTGKGTEEMALVRWAEVLPVVKTYQVKATGLARYQLSSESWSNQVAEFLAGKRKPAGKLKGISMDEILDQELVEAARKR
jgi:hypothetical protein